MMLNSMKYVSQINYLGPHQINSTGGKSYSISAQIQRENNGNLVNHNNLTEKKTNKSNYDIKR